jgi:hypothetical protein
VSGGRLVLISSLHSDTSYVYVLYLVIYIYRVIQEELPPLMELTSEDILSKSVI